MQVLRDLTYLHAIDDIDEPFLVPERDVARLQPAVRRQRVPSRFGLLPVALHHVRPSDPELSPLADTHLFPIVVHDHGFDVGVQLADTGIRGNSRGLHAASAARDLRHAPALLQVDLTGRPEAFKLFLRLAA